MDTSGLGLELWHLTPLSQQLFKLYHGCQFYWWKSILSRENHRPATTTIRSGSRRPLIQIQVSQTKIAKEKNNLSPILILVYLFHQMPYLVFPIQPEKKSSNLFP